MLPEQPGWSFGEQSSSGTEFSRIFRRVRKIAKKATVSFVMCVCPSVRPSCIEQLRSHWTDFYENLYLSIFRKSFEICRVSLTL